MDFQGLIRECRKNDKNAQQALFELIKDKLAGICIRYSKNEQQATEILKETFLSIFENGKQIPDEAAFEAWMKECLVDSAIKILQKNKQEYKIVSTAKAEDVSVSSSTISDEEVIPLLVDELVLKAMQELPPAYRVVVNMHLADGYSVKEISEKLDIAEGTVKMNFEKAMHRFRKNIVQLTVSSRV